jgi:hypothetical protein
MERERTWGERVARANRLSCSPRYGVILTDDLTRPDLPLARDCVVLVWVERDEIPADLAALERWGFSYRSNAIVLLPPGRDCAMSNDLFWCSCSWESVTKSLFC